MSDQSACQSLRGPAPAGSLDLPLGSASSRFRSNSCIGLPHKESGQRTDCLCEADLNASNSALDQFHGQQQGGGAGDQLGMGPAKDPVVESSLAIRKLSQAFGEFMLNSQKLFVVGRHQ